MWLSDNGGKAISDFDPNILLSELYIMTDLLNALADL